MLRTPHSWLPILLLSFVVCIGPTLRGEEAEKPITPVEARKKVGQTVFVEMTVKAAKDRLERRGEIYLDSEEDFHDEKNMAAVITKDGAADFKRNGVNDIAEHFRNKAIRVRGTVSVKEDVPRIEVNEFKQIELVTK
jgi:hypothetical protein